MISGKCIINKHSSDPHGVKISSINRFSDEEPVRIFVTFTLMSWLGQYLMCYFVNISCAHDTCNL